MKHRRQHHEEELPDGIDLIRAAVHDVDSRADKVARAQAEYEAARERLRSLIASGACNASCTNAGPAVTPIIAGKPPLINLDDPKVAKLWRLAFMLLANPVLDYQATAQRFYKDAPDALTAKNRVNAHMSQLRKLGIVKSIGERTFEIDRKRLAEKSKIPIEEAVMTF